MKITYIKLTGFKRFALRQSEVFEHTFNSKLTMITGPNGAGKSSLFNELTPLPADKSNYYKAGSKEIHISKEGKSYVLTSCFKEGAKYSFMCDDKELNTSGNVTAQRDLTQMHFNVTPMIHELMTGAESFTDMTALTRKKLFNSITNMNIDGILQSYDKLKEELKNNEFLQKNLTSRLVAEQHKLIDDNRKTELSARLQTFKEHIDQLFEILANLHQYKDAQSLDDVSLKYAKACQDLKTHYKAHLVSLSAYPMNVCDSLLAGQQAAVQSLSKYLQTLYTEMEHRLHEKESIELSKLSDKQIIKAEVAGLKVLSTRLIANLKIIDPETEQLNAVSAELNMLERSLPDTLESMPANPDRKLSKNAYNDLLEQSHSLTTLLHKSVAERVQISSELSELNKHKSLECPSCNHSWLPSEVTTLTAKANARMQDLNMRTAKVEQELKLLKPLLERQAAYQQQVYEVNSLYNATKKTLSSFWKIVQDQELLYIKPADIASLVSRGTLEVMDIQKQREVLKQVAELEVKLKHLEVAGNCSMSQNTLAIQTLESKISSAMEEVETLKARLADIQMSKKYHTELERLKAQTSLLNKALKAANLKSLVEELISQINTELSLSKVSVMELQNELNQHDTIKQIVKDLEEQIADTQENIKVLTILTEELSPKNGFIAKSISHFLNTIITSINSVIAGVWDYKMVLKAIDVDNDPLNYKFKLEIEDRLPVDDISKASSGMKEIINLAMKITLFKLLKFECYPAYLDELGARLDATHRSSIAGVVFKMLSSPIYSQVFLITHLDLAYGNFKDTEVIEL